LLIDWIKKLQDRDKPKDILLQKEALILKKDGFRANCIPDGGVDFFHHKLSGNRYRMVFNLPMYTNAG
jgi:hypothetical protein